LNLLLGSPLMFLNILYATKIFLPLYILTKGAHMIPLPNISYICYYLPFYKWTFFIVNKSFGISLKYMS
jgi:hypothetical protein